MKHPRRTPFQIKALLSLSILALAHAGVADTFTATTVNFANLTTAGGASTPVYIPFTLPKFDPSLGTLQSVTLSLNFSGTVLGTASEVTSPSVTHSVFFSFTDLSDNVSMAEPVLALTQSGGGTVTFGPQFQSTSLLFSVGPGDPRFEAWRNGPGLASAQLAVFFDNYYQDPSYGLVFFNGTDTGTYQGSLSISYTSVPEPEMLALLIMGLLGLFWHRARGRA